MLLADFEIRSFCVPDSFGKKIGYITNDALIDGMEDGHPWEKPMIEPFVEGVYQEGIISYGLTSAGYDLRVDPSEALVFKNSYGEAINPKRFKDPEYRKRIFDIVDISNLPNSELTIPAHSYVLIQSLEFFHMPRCLKARCVGKSTFARCGIIANLTPAEPGWNGKLTIEISNSAPCPAIIFVNEGIVQMEFEVLSSEPEKCYGDGNRPSKYQGQTSVTPARVL